MNKYQKQEIKLTKKVTNNTLQNVMLHEFKTARKYIRFVLSNRYDEFLKWYLKRLQ